MKKLTALIPVLALLLLCACSNPGAESTGNTDAPSGPAASQAVSDRPVTDTAEPSAPPSAPAGETETPQPGAEPSAAASETPAVTSTPDPTPTPDPTQTPTSEPTPAADLKAIAMSLIDHPVSELYDAIGQPLATDYAPGCLEPDSEDGELIYSGFTVYTVRTATREYIYDVL